MDVLEQVRPDDGSGPEPTRRRSGSPRKALLAVGVTALVLVLTTAAGLWYVTNRYAGNLQRDAVFTDLDEAQRPAPAPAVPGKSAPLTFLVAGSDTRGDVAEGETPDGRSDVMMLVRVTGDRRSAQVVSLPRDSWVQIPGIGMAKLNAAYAYGGPPCWSRPWRT